MSTHEDPGPALQRLMLGDRLKELRHATGLNAEEATRLLPGWYRAKLGKIEAGITRTTDSDVAELLALYQVKPDIAEDVKQLAKQARRKSPPARVADFAKQYVGLWASADELSMFSIEYVPGEFQTIDYARALLQTSVTISASEIDRIAEDRVHRASRITATGGPQVWVVLGEETLLREIGGPDVLRGQLVHLRELASLPNVTVQIMPLSAGAHVALGTPFTLLRFTNAGTSFAYVEGLTTADCLREHHARTYTLAFDRLRSTALREEESLALVDQRILDLG